MNSWTPLDFYVDFLRGIRNDVTEVLSVLESTDMKKVHILSTFNVKRKDSKNTVKRFFERLQCSPLITTFTAKKYLNL